MPEPPSENKPNIERRPEVNRYKEFIKQGDLLNKNNPNRDQMADRLLGMMGIYGTDTINDIYDKRDAPNYPQEVIQEKVKDLGQAFYEIMSEDPEMKKAIVAGSSSTEKFIPECMRKDELNGKNYIGGGIGEAIVDSYYSNQEIRGQVEMVDYIIHELNLNDQDNLSVISAARASLIKPDSFKTYSAKDKAALKEILNHFSEIENSIKGRTNQTSHETSNKDNQQSARNGNGEDNGDTDEMRRYVNRRSGAEFKYSNENFPSTRKEQLEFIEERLNLIENAQATRSITDLRTLDYATPLLYLVESDVASEEIRTIIKTRLFVKEIGDALRANGGVVGNDILLRKIDYLVEEKMDLSPEIIKAFFENRLPGLKTAEAWNLMEMANFGYQTMLRQAEKYGSEEIRNRISEYNRKIRIYNEAHPGSLKGDFFNPNRLVKNHSLDDTKYKGFRYNYYLDTFGNNERAKILKDYLIEKIEGVMIEEKGVNRRNLNEKDMADIKYRARKSMQVAESMYAATGESWVVDWDFVGGDQVGEAVNLELNRILDGPRNKKGKKVGPEISVNHIETLTPGFVRQFSGIKHPLKPAYAGENIFLRQIRDNEIVETVENGYSGEYHSIRGGEKINFDKLEGKQLWGAYWVSIFLKKQWPARIDIGNQATPSPKDVLNLEYLKDRLDWFNKVDSQIEKDEEGVPKTAWLAGIFQMILYHPDASRSWTEKDIRTLKSLVVDYDYTTDENDQKQKFVTDKQWNWIAKEIGFNKGIRSGKVVNVIGDIFTKRK